MGNMRIIQRSFASGEVSPEMWGRSDDTGYGSGLATCRNFVTTPQGVAQNRAGFAFVREVKDSTKRVRLIPFTYSTTQTMIIEMGEGYFRFHTQGATLMDGDAPYEIANPYAEAYLMDIHYVQSSDVMTLVHPEYAPRELRRLGALSWELITIDFSPPVEAPTNTVATAYGAPITDTYAYHYCVTTLDADGRESVASNIDWAINRLSYTGAYNNVTWTEPAVNSGYNIYKRQSGLFGFIGYASNPPFTDDNITPDLSRCPPIYDNPFSGADNMPGAVSYWEQRRVFAGTTNKPQNIWMTQSGTESGMAHSTPVRDDDRIAFRVAAREANTIRHILPLNQLLLMTGAAEWRATSVNSDSITPSSFSVNPQSYIGASNVTPVICNNVIVFAAARGGHVREMAYSYQAGGYQTGDVSIRAAHLFDGLYLVDMAYSKAPLPIVWCVSSSGQLLGLTYVPEQQIGAWHRHDTDGTFEALAVVAEGEDDVLYAIIARTIGGATKRYVERMTPRRWATAADAFHVDSGLSYSGSETVTFSGLDHLEGREVAILADGAVHPRRTVQSGAITLEQPASVVHIGLPITADLATLPFAAQVDQAAGQGRAKSVNRVWLRVYKSAGIWAGPNADSLREFKQRTTEPYGSPPAWITGEIEISPDPVWSMDARVLVRQSDPLPLSVASIALEVALGG